MTTIKNGRLALRVAMMRQVDPGPVEAFLERCRLKGYSLHTIRSYETDLKKAEAAMGDLLAATDAQVEAFLHGESARGLHPTTVGRRLNTLRSFYKDARRHRLTTEDPTLGVDPPKKPKRLPRYLKDDEIAALMATLGKSTAAEAREAAIVLTFYHTGMRLAELIGLNVEDVTGQDVRVFGKGSKERTIPINATLREALDTWLSVHPAGTNALFTSLGVHASRLGPQQTRAIVKGAFKRAGLEGRRFTPHKLRHTFATRLLNRGVRLDIIQRLLGHASVSTTQVYAHTELGSEVREALDRVL